MEVCGVFEIKSDAVIVTSWLLPVYPKLLTPLDDDFSLNVDLTVWKLSVGDGNSLLEFPILLLLFTSRISQKFSAFAGTEVWTVENSTFDCDSSFDGFHQNDFK